MLYYIKSGTFHSLIKTETYIHLLLILQMSLKYDLLAQFHLSQHQYYLSLFTLSFHSHRICYESLRE